MTERIAADLRERRKQTAIELTSYLLHKHYCENDVESMIRLFDDRFSWMGAGEQEYAVGREKVIGIFRQFAGQVPSCNITEEEYDAIELSEDVFLCTGRLWITTDSSTQICLRVHQRVSMIFRWVQEQPYCCHIHISNPYVEMAPEDVGFPSRMARQSYEYMQECIAEQKKQIRERTEELSSIYHTVPCAIIRVLRTEKGCRLLTYNEALKQFLGIGDEAVRKLDWSRGFCSRVDEEDAPDLETLLKKLSKPGDTLPMDYRIHAAGGKIIHVRSINSLIREDEKGQIIQRIDFDITDRVKLESMLKRRSYEDSLTGLYNRNKFNAQMRYVRNDPNMPLGVAYFDINGLKAVNDLFGHREGDNLIRRTARHIADYFGRNTYRIGGDEFVVIEEGPDEHDFLERIRRSCQDMEADGIHIAVGYSWRSLNGDVNEQFDEADHKMYQDKREYYSVSRPNWKRGSEE